MLGGGGKGWVGSQSPGGPFLCSVSFQQQFTAATFEVP